MQVNLKKDKRKERVEESLKNNLKKRKIFLKKIKKNTINIK
tara:strand:- start:297 stop:419 length:123 start_codon:yes stop_codon:yes gene_type:complete